jgi:PDZ domain-containing protein
MDQSKHDATAVVLSELGLGTSKGALVTETVPDSPADGALQKGDKITAVDGRPIGSYCDVGGAIREHKPGEEVSLTVVRDGKKQTISVKTIENPQVPGAAFIGVAMKDDFSSDVKVDFKTGRIAGPSAGLMFTLGLYDQLTPDDLTHGEVIAGTGTIACDGTVGPIGGIEQKVAAAEGNGAVVFIAPASEAEAARAVADEMEVVPVETFSDAVEYLEGL